MGATGALTPVILGQYYSHLPLAPAILGKSITVSTRNSKVLNMPLELQGHKIKRCMLHSKDKFYCPACFCEEKLVLEFAIDKTFTI